VLDLLNIDDQTPALEIYNRRDIVTQFPAGERRKKRKTAIPGKRWKKVNNSTTRAEKAGRLNRGRYFWSWHEVIEINHNQIELYGGPGGYP